MCNILYNKFNDLQYILESEEEQTFIYIFCAENLATVHGTFKKMNPALKLAQSLSKRTYEEFLSDTFFNSTAGDAFTKSGYTPSCLVANYLWITKQVLLHNK